MTTRCSASHLPGLVLILMYPCLVRRLLPSVENARPGLQVSEQNRPLPRRSSKGVVLNRRPHLSQILVTYLLVLWRLLRQVAEQ